MGVRGAKPPEADGILVLEHTFFALSWSISCAHVNMYHESPAASKQ